MIFDYQYYGKSQVSDSGMSFVPDASRQSTYFVGTLGDNVRFREAISALHKVVLDDQRYKPRDTTAYKEWAKAREMKEYQELLLEQQSDDFTIRETQEQLDGLRAHLDNYRVPDREFQRAKAKYVRYLYKVNRDAWWVLDPVITVHPDSLFFECFSKDESSYGKLSCKYDVFSNISEYQEGTTNIDYSYDLYNEFQKIRDYRQTDFTVEPGGFTVETQDEEAYREVKIDLPDSWVRGFLQVSSAMALPSKKVRFSPMDIYSFCLLLRQKREKVGPRSIRFELTPGEPPVVIFDPWGTKFVCRHSVYMGDSRESIRIWGRRRIHILERLIPIAKHFDLYLLGYGLPYFFVADLGTMEFTLGLSGWSSNNFSASGNFDLLAPREEVDDVTKVLVFEELKKTWFATVDELAQNLNLDKAVVASVLSSYTQAGRVVYDLDKDVYRARELSRDPLPMEQLRFSNPQEEAAMRFVQRKAIENVDISSFTFMKDEKEKEGMKVQAVLKGQSGGDFHSTLCMDEDRRILSSHTRCSCRYFADNALRKGPCAHLLALRLFTRGAQS